MREVSPNAARSRAIFRVGILSDTHHDVSAIRRAMERLQAAGPLDTLCFLGDCSSDLPLIESFLLPSQKTAVHAVRGNNDLLSSLPDEVILRLGGKKVLLVHGHLQRVKMHRVGLLCRGEEAGADIVLFGHTHQQECAYERGLLFLNPGAASGLRPTCASLEIDGERIIPTQYAL